MKKIISPISKIFKKLLCFLQKHDMNKSLTNKIQSIVVSLMRYIFLISVSYVVLYPLFYMISVSLKSEVDSMDASVIWVPKHFSIENFETAFEAMKYVKSFLSTLVIEVFSAAIEVFSCAFVAYGFARFQFKEKKLLEGILLLTILIPIPMIIIPLMVNFKQTDFFGILGLIGNFLGKEIRPNLLNTPFTFYIPSIFAVGLRSGILIYIYIQFFKGLPKELEEAAWIDGAGPFKTFFRIALPSSGVVILTVSIFALIWHWNDFYMASMLMSKNLPLAVALSQIRETLEVMRIFHDNPRISSIVMAGCTMYIAPMLVVYLIIQRKFIASIDRVGIVG